MFLQFKVGLLLSLSLLLLRSQVESTCSRGCALALGSYYVWSGTNLTFIAEISNGSMDQILRYNPQIPNQDSVLSDTRISIPFTCDCIGGQFLGHVFEFSVRPRDTYDRVAELYYSNLTTEEWVMRFNSYDATRIPDTDATLNVTVNCSCGDRRVSRDYGWFQTYPLRPEDSLATIASQTNLTADLIRSYNPDSNFSAGTGLVYIPAQDETGNYPPLNISAGLSRGVIAGISVAGVAGFLLLAGCLYFVFYRKMKGQEIVSLLTENEDQAIHTAHGITVDKSVEFSYEELAKATDDFSIAYKIGQGGFGAVYYAELRGEKAAIKKMEMQASKEFLAELKVLTHVHHLNLVRLIGYCVEGSLCLVYEFIENGNLSQHLRGSERDPLPWSTRVQIALDSARGLEYIHEHTVSVYIHRDIKSANILIDKNFHAKVADFGLTKLTEVGTTSMLTGLVGTFGYMPPEYAKLGGISPKIDVYAFGVVLYELISGKEAIVKENGSFAELRGLVALFDEVFSQPDPREELGKLVDPRLGDTCHLDSVYKIAQLAKACTHEEPQLRPSMRSIVVALTTLSSSTEDWDVGILYENQGLVNLMSGR